MNGQQFFYSFLPGLTAVVLTAHPTFANTVQVSKVRLVNNLKGVELISQTTNKKKSQQAPSNNSPNVTTSGQKNQANTAATQPTAKKNTALSLKTILPEFSLRSTAAALLQINNSPETSQIAQGTVTIPTGLVAQGGSVPVVPDRLTPNPNPLLYPTRPQEVTVGQVQPLTLNQALEIARRNSQELQTALIQLEGDRAALKEQQAALLPTLGINAGINRGQSSQEQLRNEVTAERNRNQPFNPIFNPRPGIVDPDPPATSFRSTAEFTYNLYTSGARNARIRRAEEQVRSRELEIERVSEQLRLDVATDYYNLQQADENYRIALSAVRNAQASLKDALALLEAGVGTRFDVLRSQVNLANAQQDLTTALSQQEIGRRQLATRLNVPQSVSITTTSEPIAEAGTWTLSLEDSIILALQNRAELQQDIAQRNINEQQRREALSALGPQIAFVASYEVLDVFNDSNALTDGYSVGIQAQMNIFDGGAARARAAQASSGIRLAETQFSVRRNQIRLEVEQGFYNLQSNRRNIQTSTEAVRQADEALRLARLRFGAGVGTQTDVIAAENDLTRAQANRSRAIIDYNRSLVNLQRAVSSSRRR